MDTELHEFCKRATPALHDSLNDTRRRGPYFWRMDTKEEAGRRIKTAREARKLTLAEVNAQLPEISVSRLSNWEQGLNMIGVEEAKKLAPVLSVTAAYILTLDDAPTDPRERALVGYFRHSDERGRTQILRVAESESTYAVTEDGADDKAA